ncbi:MAG TPA: serine/threonine-protein kinase, partial [Polyangiales bacterium]
VSYACTLYYIGPFSQAAMTGALGLYIFCLGSRHRWASAVYAALAAPHGIIAVLGTLGVITDRGLITASKLSPADQLALQAVVQAVYAIAYVAGRKSRGKLRDAFLELEAAARVIAQRDALLTEAKRDLERAVRIGGDGRFTDQVIGSFRLGKVIGRGGMGEVYDAVHIETDQPAAVKLLHRNVIADPEAVARFAREAKAAASFDSPYVVRVLEIGGEDSSIPYLAMERLRGEDLASMLRREQRLSSRELVELARQVGKALDEAQRVGVIHRDIKPQNLFLARNGDGSSAWKVLDFGVSKLVGQGTLTRDQLVGTPEYMAPEQASGEKTDHRADLYGLAAVLYRCVASRAPFVENSLVVLVQNVINRMPARPSSVARVPSDIEAFLAIGLAKSPADRFATGAELAEVLELAVAGRLTQAQRTRARRVLEERPWSEGAVALNVRPHAG